MGVTTDFDLEITVLTDDFLDQDGADEMAAKLQKIRGLEDVSAWPSAAPSAPVVYVSAGTDECPARDYAEWAEEVSAKIFMALGRCEISWSWYYRERAPDDYTHFSEDDYNDMVSPLHQLAFEAEETR